MMRLPHDDQMRQAQLAFAKTPSETAGVVITPTMINRARALTPATIVLVKPNTLRRFRQVSGGQRQFRVLAGIVNRLRS